MNMDLHEEQSRREVVTKSSYASGTNSTKRGTECSSSEVKKNLKITLKDQKMHHLIFQEGGLADGTEVEYKSSKRDLKIYKRGHTKGRRIYCYCCKEEMSPSMFEIHAGMGSRKKPYDHIFLLNGMSLKEYAVSLKIKCENVTKENDALCNVCRLSGDLLACEGCPRSFHKECINEPVLPLEKWFCKYCVKSMKCVAPNAKRRIKISDKLDNCQIVACVLCRSYDFSDVGFNDRTVIVCDQCEKEYHIGCLREHKNIELEQLPQGIWICTEDCVKIYDALNGLNILEPESIDESLMNIITPEDSISNRDVKWIIRRGKDSSKETRLLLKQAVKIFHECFDPIIDSVTGNDFIPKMAYGLQMGDSDFSGVYCAMIIINSKVITAGMFRVFGFGIAELPLVATREPNQGKGYFQLFFSCFERLLSYLQVKKLVVPAAKDTKAMWTNKFDFNNVHRILLNEYKQKHTTMVAFHGTSLLEKRVPKGQRTFKIGDLFRESRVTKKRRSCIKNNHVASSSVDPPDSANELREQNAQEQSLLKLKEENIQLQQRVFDLECQLAHVKNELKTTRKKLEKSESEKSGLRN